MKAVKTSEAVEAVQAEEAVEAVENEETVEVSSKRPLAFVLPCVVYTSMAREL